jgi:plastocyanin
MAQISRTVLFVALAVALVASALAVPLAGASSITGPRPAKAVAITLHASFNAPTGWGLGANNITEPGPTLTVNQGDVITFSLFSNDTMPHQLIIDLDNSHSNSTGDGWSYPFSSKTTAATFIFTASTAGTFAYFCNIHGYSVQHGTFVVNMVSTPPPPAADNTLLIVGGIIVVVIVVAGAAAAMRMRKKKP